MTSAARQSPEARLQKYHPVRFYLMRDDPLWDAAIEAKQRAFVNMPGTELSSVSEYLYGFYLREREKMLGVLEPYMFPPERLKRAFSEEYGDAAGRLEVCICDWVECGEQLFDLSPISAMFIDSDASSMPIGELKLPYDCFYLHWGKHLEMAGPINGRFIEGCYVSRTEYEWGETQINFTFISSTAPEDQWDTRSLMANITVDAEGSFGLLGFLDESDSIGGMAREFREPGFYENGTVERWGSYVDAALNMAANCMCYLVSSKAEIVEGYPVEAPARLVSQTKSLRSTERRRGASKLDALGFRVIKLCGQNLAASIGLKADSREMPAHWRRGHWHAVRFGKLRSQVRVDWRDGLVVNAGKGDPKGGRIYKP